MGLVSRLKDAQIDAGRSFIRKKIDLTRLHCHSIEEVPITVFIDPYVTFGTQVLARHVTEGISLCNAILFANHGLVTVGADMTAAFITVEEIDFVTRVYHQTKIISEPTLLPDREIEIIIKKFQIYGQLRK